MSEEIDLEKVTIWFNKVDLDLFGYSKTFVQIEQIKKVYGYCIVCSEDLSTKQLQKLFKRELIKNK